mmetsp:Transcript_74986/g.175989  ORF Transcript_74986/g.175989 Transcript_74986/m.175989 type:complete len:249 (+) Transcript_74986:2-748(+)
MTRCDVDRRRGLSATEFLEEYVDKNKPVLLEGALDGWPLWERWTKQSLLQRHGHVQVQVANSSHVVRQQQQLTTTTQHMTLREYVERYMEDESPVSDDPPYVFTQHKLQDLSGDFFALDYFDQTGRWTLTDSQRRSQTTFSLGPRNAGASLHMHSNSWNALFYGRKRWLLVSPMEDWGYRHLSSSQWVQHALSKQTAEIVECVQHAGDVMWVPAHWGHGVVNLEHSVGMSVEVGYDRTLPTRVLGAKQ